MVDVGPVTVGEAIADDADLAVFVQRIASAGTDPAGVRARDQIVAAVRRGAAPPGVRRLAEALAASVDDAPPLQRRSSEESGSVAAAVGGSALMILDGFGTDELATAIAAVVTDGRRVVVTAEQASDLDAVRTGLPSEVAARCLDRLPELSPDELRRLRALLATSTPARRRRRDQQVTPTAALPDPATVAELGGRAGRSAAEGGAGLIAGVLASLERDRVEAVTSIARCVDRSLGALRTRERPDWTWTLLGDLVHSRHQATFDRMLEDTAQVLAGIERASSTEPVTVEGPLPDHAVETLHRYAEFLRSGGRARSYFRSTAQREVAPILEQVRVGGRPVRDAAEVSLVLAHAELRRRCDAVAAGCVETGLPVPRGDADLADLADGVTKVAAAARSVGALRHDVLFLHADSPVAVPDLDAAERVAAAILEYDEYGSPVHAAAELDRAATELAAGVPADTLSPEQARAGEALRAGDADGYAAAVETLDAVRREIADERRGTELLAALAATAPRLAAAWKDAADAASTGRGAFGFAAFVPTAELLGTLPARDSADVVVVVGAQSLGVQRLLLAAVAPRLAAVVSPEAIPAQGPTMLSVLRRAGARTIHGRSSARVVPFGNGARPTVSAAARWAGA